MDNLTEEQERIYAKFMAKSYALFAIGLSIIAGCILLLERIPIGDWIQGDGIMVTFIIAYFFLLMAIIGLVGHLFFNRDELTTNSAARGFFVSCALIGVAAAGFHTSKSLSDAWEILASVFTAFVVLAFFGSRFRGRFAPLFAGLFYLGSNLMAHVLVAVWNYPEINVDSDLPSKVFWVGFWSLAVAHNAQTIRREAIVATKTGESPLTEKAPIFGALRLLISFLMMLHHGFELAKGLSKSERDS